MSTGLDIAQYLVQAYDVKPWPKPYVFEPEEPIDFNLPIEHWSPSSLEMFWRCPYQWQQRYVHGRKERPAEAPVMGLAVHAAVERNFGQKIETHVDLPLAELLDWYADDGFIRVVVDEQEKANEEILWDTGPEQARDRGKAILAAYQHTVAGRIQPTAVETMIAHDFGAAVPVIGRFDVEREASVIDVKTGKRKQSTPKPSWRVQAGVYSEARGKPVEFHSCSATTSTSTPTIVTPLESEALLVQPSPAERSEMRARIRAIESVACLYMKIYGADLPWPTQGVWHEWACSYCGFRSGCPAWKE